MVKKTAPEKTKEDVFVNFMVVSDYAIIGENGKLGIIGAFDILGIPSFPAGHPEMFLVANTKGSSFSEHDIQLRLEDPLGQDLLSPNSPHLKMKLSGTGSGNLIQRFLNLTFHRPGIHKFVLLIDGKRAGETELTVIKVDNGKIDNRKPN